MSMEIKHPAPEGAAQERYERRDASAKSLLKFALWMIAIMVVVFIAMERMFVTLGKIQPLGPPASPIQDARVLPPHPRLQVQPRNELREFCAGQTETVNSYAWIDQRMGVARIPVTRAMDLLAERGLPSRSPDKNSAAAAASEIQPDAFQAPSISDVQGPCGFVQERSLARAERAEK